jgi:hypothetical protein
MRTCCSTRNRCQAPSRPGVPVASNRHLAQPPLRRATSIAALAAIGSALLAGCTDDVVCSNEPTPYVTARVEEVGAARAGSTYVEVYCASDPRMSPSSLDVSVGGRQLSDPTEAPDHVGFLLTLSDTLVVWQPGVSCALSVTTESGIASGKETVPASFTVTAPETTIVGETLTLSWTQSSGADYYRVRATLDGPAGTDELDFAVDGTSVSLDGTEVGHPGALSGVVWAVSGRFPETGAAGNIGGEGWGYYSIAYRDAAGEFEVVVRDSARCR